MDYSENQLASQFQVLSGFWSETWPEIDYAEIDYVNDWVCLFSAVTLNQDSDRTRLVCWTGKAGLPED